jgi:hypothetical protein
MGNINMIMAKHESMINVWRQRVMECKTSGLTVAEWCQQNHINKKTYFYWQKQVWDHEINTMVPDRPPDLPSTVQFAEIRMPSGPVVSGDADIILHRGDWTLEIRNSVDPMLLCRILEAVNNNV